MNYEIEQKLRGKVDDWEYRSLQQKVSSLEHDIIRLEKDAVNATNTISNMRYAIDNLLACLIETLPDKANELYTIKEQY